MLITFIANVTLAGQPAGSGPHYTPGYCCDVPEPAAAAFIARGLAVAGRVAVEPPAPAEVEPPAAADDRQPPSPQKQKRWGR